MPLPDLTQLVYALGRLTGATRFASPDIRRVRSLVTVANAWRAYRRDAGAGDVGSAHQPSNDPNSILMTDDPRRDAVVLWLAAHGVPAIAEAATTVVHMVNAARGFEVDALALLSAAQDTVAQKSVDGPLVRACRLTELGPDHPLRGMTYALAAADVLITTTDFAESHGHDAILSSPSRLIRHYVSAAPAGCWALNLVLVAHGVMPFVTGMIPRTVFRLDLNDIERASSCIDHSTHVSMAAFKDFERIEIDLDRGRNALAGLSRNARTGEAWALAMALGPTTRTQIRRVLGLSRAGADIQAHSLAAFGLVELAASGRVIPTLPGTSLLRTPN